MPRFVAVLLSLAACSAAPPPAPSLTSGGAVLATDGGSSKITWKRGDRTLVSFAADGVVLGVVPALDDSQSDDPFWLSSSRSVGR